MDNEEEGAFDGRADNLDRVDNDEPIELDERTELPMVERPSMFEPTVLVIPWKVLRASEPSPTVEPIPGSYDDRSPVSSVLTGVTVATSDFFFLVTNQMRSPSKRRRKMANRIQTKMGTPPFSCSGSTVVVMSSVVGSVVVVDSVVVVVGCVALVVSCGVVVVAFGVVAFVVVVVAAVVVVVDAVVVVVDAVVGAAVVVVVETMLVGGAICRHRSH